MAQSLTLKMAKLGPIPDSTAYIYIHTQSTRAHAHTRTCAHVFTQTPSTLRFLREGSEFLKVAFLRITFTLLLVCTHVYTFQARQAPHALRAGAKAAGMRQHQVCCAQRLQALGLCAPTRPDKQQLFPQPPPLEVLEEGCFGGGSSFFTLEIMRTTETTR